MPSRQKYKVLDNARSMMGALSVFFLESPYHIFGNPG